MSLEILLEAALFVERQTQGNNLTHVFLLLPAPPRNKQWCCINHSCSDEPLVTFLSKMGHMSQSCLCGYSGVSEYKGASTAGQDESQWLGLER